MNRISTDQRRVVVTGLGVISASGTSLGKFWENVYLGRSSVKPISRFNASALPTPYAAEIMDFSVADYVGTTKAGRYDLSVQYSLAAATLAKEDSGFNGNVDPLRVGVIEGTTISAMESILKAQKSYSESYKKIHPYNVVGGYFGEGSSTISLHLGLQGHAMTYCSGCASGADSIGHAMRIIQDDEADIMFAGGAEAIMELMHAGFCKLKAMTALGGDPKKAMRPFDSSRDGFVLGEGAAFLVLEELGHALNRKARIYAELLGHGRTSEAYHSTDPHPEGHGYEVAMERALKISRLAKTEVDYINAHGSATPLNDPVETRAIKKVFQKHASKLAVSASKPIFGHLMGASGAMESAVTILSLAHSQIPPTINLETPDPQCGLDYVPHEGRPYPIKTAISLNAGFGGRYSCLAFQKLS